MFKGGRLRGQPVSEMGSRTTGGDTLSQQDKLLSLDLTAFSHFMVEMTKSYQIVIIKPFLKIHS